MLIQELEKKKLITPPSWLGTNCPYLTIMGSNAYGVSSDTSDWDIYGFAIPPLDQIFPHLAGEIIDFGTQKKRFREYQQHHIDDKEVGKMYDISVFSIVRYFHLCLENNPNVLDSLFTPTECVVHITQVGQLVRDHRREFLHKGCWPRFRGYSFSQLHKASTKNPVEGKRKELRDKFGCDVKFLMHVVRLLLECEQILTTGDLNLRRDSEYLKAIRRGEVSEEEVRKWFTEKELQLEKIYAESTLPWGPDEDKIKELLLQCLTIQYGSLDKCIHVGNEHEIALRKIEEIIDDLKRKNNGTI